MVSEVAVDNFRQEKICIMAETNHSIMGMKVKKIINLHLMQYSTKSKIQWLKTSWFWWCQVKMPCVSINQTFFNKMSSSKINRRVSSANQINLVRKKEMHNFTVLSNVWDCWLWCIRHSLNKNNWNIKQMNEYLASLTEEGRTSITCQLACTYHNLRTLDE